MSKIIPTIQRYMTAVPHTIGDSQTLAQASRKMREFSIRHLPVLRGGKLLGVLTDRDIKLVETFRDVDPEKITVADAMTEKPYTVRASSSLDEVVNEMAEHKYGSAIVLDNDKVVGIFTTVDACRALAELLNTRLRK